MTEKRGRGKPVVHPNVACINTGEVFRTYTEAAKAIGGSRYGVRKCCNGELKTHHGYRFIHTSMGVGRYDDDWCDLSHEL